MMYTTPAWALEKINIEKDVKSRGLDLSGFGKNDDAILSEIPAEILELNWLEELDLSNNRLTHIPKDIFRLQELRFLNLSDNRLSKLPDTLGQLHNLQYLALSDNKLNEIPESINQLKKLAELSLSGNRDLSLPSFMSQFQMLRMLSLDRMELQQIPETVMYLPSLEELSLNENQIREIPPQLFTLSNLRYLRLAENPIEIPPPEITFLKRNYGRDNELADVNKIQDYFRQLEAKGKDYLYEAKLLIVGEGGAGKTTLARKINDPDYQLQDEKTTEGISVINWHFPMDSGKHFRVNIWDFGGQEIYHSTHQFFLTKRSLYVLVADTRKDDTDFYYWLNVIELLSDNSPILIIKNEKQDRRRELNERQLHGQFGNLKETLATNLATNRGLTKVLGEIEHHIARLPHVGSVLPKTWVRVRDALEKYPRNYISINEYLKICEKNGFSELRDKLQLSGYLHDLGVCLHFQDDPILNKTIILKPEWGTYAVYKVLDNQKVISNLGQFTKFDLLNIWNSPEYANMHDELLQLMMKFRLCYKIPNKTDTYIAPQLLTENQPVYQWVEKDNLLLRYIYEFMPKGILSQLIVALHQFILEHTYVWKSGMVLEKDSTRAEVIENYGKREISIRVSGKHKKELMSLVMYELDKIHSTYKQLKLGKLIPCNCMFCKDNQEPHFYPYDVLRRFTEDKQDHIQCLKSYKSVSVWGLIDDVVERRFVDQDKQNRSAVGTSYEIKVGDGADVGTIVVGSSIDGSFVSSSNKEMEMTLKMLGDAVGRMCLYLPESQAKEAMRDFDSLAKEAVSKSPNPKWYQISAEGLTKAGLSIGAIGKPVIELASKIVSLLMLTKG